MSLIRRNRAQPLRPEDDNADELCTLKEAAEILRLSEASIRMRQAGTERLTHVRQGKPGSQRPRVMLVRAEVLAHRHQLIEEARQQARHYSDSV